MLNHWNLCYISAHYRLNTPCLWRLATDCHTTLQHTTELHKILWLGGMLQGCVRPSTQLNRTAHNPAAHHRATELCVAQWCAEGFCAGPLGRVEGQRESTLLSRNHMRLLHSPSLVAIGLSVGYETLPPIGRHHAFVIAWSKDRLRLPSAPFHYGPMWPVGIISKQLPAVRAVQGDCESLQPHCIYLQI